jgi:hypothetical protein
MLRYEAAPFRLHDRREKGTALKMTAVHFILGEIGRRIARPI